MHSPAFSSSSGPTAEQDLLPRGAASSLAVASFSPAFLYVFHPVEDTFFLLSSHGVQKAAYIYTYENSSNCYAITNKAQNYKVKSWHKVDYCNNYHRQIVSAVKLFMK